MCAFVKFINNLHSNKSAPCHISQEIEKSKCSKCSEDNCCSSSPRCVTDSSNHNIELLYDKLNNYNVNLHCRRNITNELSLRREHECVDMTSSLQHACIDNDENEFSRSKNNSFVESWSQYGPSRPSTPTIASELYDKDVSSNNRKDDEYILIRPIFMKVILVIVLCAVIIVSLPLNSQQELAEIVHLFSSN